MTYADLNGDGEVTPGEIIEENNYYPFGLKHQGYNELAGDAHKYKFLNREYQPELGLNTIATDYRHYDAALGRFNNMDALSELAPNQTPYRYGFNNPVYWTDPTGLFESYGAAYAWGSQYFTSFSITNSKGIYSVDTESLSFYMNNGNFYTQYWSGDNFYSIAGLVDEGPSSGGSGSNSGSSGSPSGNGPGGPSGPGPGAGPGGPSNGAGPGGPGGSGPAGQDIDWAHVNQDISTFGVINSAKTGLIEIAGETGSLTKTASNYLKFFKTAGVFGSVVTTAYSGYNVLQQYEQGGITEVIQHRDVLDAAVGVIGLAATGAAYFGIISNPVGWAIGAGVVTYYVGTMIYDYYNP